MVVPICYDELSYPVELPVITSLTSKGSQEVTTRIEDLNPMVVPICYDELSYPVDCHSRKAVKLSLPIAVSSQPKPVLSKLVKYLDSVVGRVSDDHGVVGSHCNTSRPCEKSGLAPPSAEFQYQGLL